MIDALGLMDRSLTEVDLTHGMDAGQVLDHAHAARRMKRIGFNNELMLAAHWADCHPGDSINPHQLRLPGGDRPIRPGGDGTPDTARFAVTEYAVENGLPTGTAEHLIADALDLRHRLPRLDRRMRTYQVDARDCQTIARQTRHLTMEQALGVDEEIAPIVGQVSFYRLMQLLEAAVIRADPDRVQQLAERAKQTLGAWLGQVNEHGIKAVYMQLKAADALWFYAALDQMAGVLQRRGHTGTKGERFSEAARVLALPLLALRYLAEDTEPTLFDPDPEQTPDDELPLDEDELPPDPADEPGPPSRDLRIEQDRRLAEQAIAAIGQIDPAKLLPDATLYVHIAMETLRDGLGVTRVEDLGPIVSSVVADWLHDCHVTIKPVIDLNTDLTPVDAHEIPKAMRERVFLKHPGSMFPFSNQLGRHLDIDHNIPYVPGLPGQTREDNLIPAGRREHNVFTHGPGWGRRRPSPGTILFRAPHGRIFLVNQTGSHDLGQDSFAQHIWHAAAPTTHTRAA